MMPRAFQIQTEDNVATLIDEALPGTVQIIGAGRGEVKIVGKLLRRHNLALRDIAMNEPVIKYGVRIGHATKPIARGAWIHLHNLASDLDERSGTLDLHSGAPTDTDSAYV